MAHGTTQNHNAGEEPTADGLKFFERQIITRVNNNDVTIYGLQNDGSYGLSYYDTNGDQRLLIGPDSTGSAVVKISQTGYDASTASGANLIFNSGQNIFKIVLSGTASSTVPTPFPSNTTITTSIPHGMAVKPAFIAFVDIPTGDGSTIIQGKLNTVPTSAIVKSGPYSGLTSVQVSADVDITNLNLRITNTFGAGITGMDGTWSFKYYILQETAN